jgi:hypothetical protein
LLTHARRAGALRVPDAAVGAGAARRVPERAAGADAVAASIFVNPLQFNAGDDLARYPRDEEGDLAKLRAAGCGVLRIGFNRGDEAFWAGRPGYIPFTSTSDAWPAFLSAILSEHTVTDIALYGDSRPVHAEARRLGIPIVAIVDTNADPEVIDYPIAGNDDAIRSIRVILQKLADAIGSNSTVAAKKESAELAGVAE